MGDIIVEKLCPFCNGIARIWNVQNVQNFDGYDCKVCKMYFVSNEAVQKLKILPRQQVLNCIAENIKSNATVDPVITYWQLEHEKAPELASDITIKSLESIATLPIIHSQKTNGLLMQLAGKAFLLSPFEPVGLTLQDLYSLKIADFGEAYRWLLQLHENGYIESNYLRSQSIGKIHSNQTIYQFQAIITPKGWSEVFKSQQTLNSKKVFIAMQFKWDDSMVAVRNKFIEALKLGCADCGYDASIVSQEHVDQITDRIVAEIKASRFVIADFTYNNQGAYYEAGLARGLGKKVIHTVMQGHTDDQADSKKRLHFDIKQINYLEWSDPTEVREKIRDRIKAVIE